MRILYIINAFSWSGAERLVYDLALKIRNCVEYVGIAALYRNNGAAETEMICNLRNAGIAAYTIGKEAGSGRIRTIRILTQIAKTNQVDLIHGHCSVPMLFAKIVGTILRLPVACTIHSTRGYSKAREKLTSWMVDKYVSIGAAAEAYMETDLAIAKEKIVRIYNAIDTEHFYRRTRDERFWENYGGKPGEQVLLNVARVHEAKNQMCIARAVKKCLEGGYRDFRVYILGAYEERSPVYQELAHYIDSEKLMEHIVFLGMHSNVSDFLANADCFVMTSAYEGLSVAFLEAVISGLPIVVTDMPFVHELNEIAPCSTIIPQNDSGKLARIIEQQCYTGQRDETVRRFQKLFSMERFVQQHMHLYSELLRIYSKHK